MNPVYILAIESSCDDTSAAVLGDGIILSNVIANQALHAEYGGIVPEVASRLHQENISLVVDTALQKAGIGLGDVDAIACTTGPGLMGSLTVGLSYAKSIALSLGIPFISVNHMEAHVLSHFIEEPRPEFPFLNLTVSGGHTQLVIVHDYNRMEIIGQTLDDAAGEAFDKSGKILGLPYPAGPLIDKLAKEGKPVFKFPISNMEGYDFSFSGLKTAILYFVKGQVALDPDFITKNIHDLCASIQHTIIEILIKKVEQAAIDKDIARVGIAGGVAANNGLRRKLEEKAETHNWSLYFPSMQYCTDNAGMIAKAASFRYAEKSFDSLDVKPFVRS